MIFALLSILSTSLLSIISQDSYVIASIFFSISLLGFMMSNVFYDSMLLNFNSQKYDSISSVGYALGYLGGGLAFVISLLFLYFQSDSTLELISSKKIVFLFASIWWLVFMMPLFLFWEEDKRIPHATTLFDTFNEIKLDKTIFYFLIAYWIYICLLYTSPSPRDGLLSRMPSSG